MRLQSITDRLRYLGALLRPSTWRWFLARVDFMFEEKIFPAAAIRLGRRSWVHPSVRIRHGENVVCGDDARIQANCVLWASPNAKITIGDFSGIGPGTMMFTSNHTFAPSIPYHQQPWKEADITIGRDVWIGAGTILVAGVTVGDGTVVAAGSVVTKDIPPQSIAAGSPARVIRARGEAKPAVDPS